MMCGKPHLQRLHIMPSPVQQSYYAPAAATAPLHSALEGEQACDVCVAGAGIAGCAAALHLSARGQRVIVLEGARVGHGACARAGGELIHHDVDELAGLDGRAARDDWRRLWRLRLDAAAATTALIDKHRIACDFAGGQFIAAVKPRHDRRLRDYKRALEEGCGHAHLLFIEKDYLDEFARTPRYVSGLYDARGGHVHPVKLALGLAAAARGLGAEFHELTPAVQVEPGASILVRTPKGTVRCRRLLLCGTGDVGGLPIDPERRPPLIGAGATVTEPLGEERARDILPANAAVADMNFLRDSFSLTADWRLLFGAWIGDPAPSRARLATLLRQRMLRVFPQLRDVRQEYAWSGAADSPPRAPRFARPHPNAFFADGCARHGVAMAVLGGRLLAEAVMGNAGGFDFIARMPRRERWGTGFLRGPLRALATMYHRFRDPS